MPLLLVGLLQKLNAGVGKTVEYDHQVATDKFCFFRNEGVTQGKLLAISTRGVIKRWAL